MLYSPQQRHSSAAPACSFPSLNVHAERNVPTCIANLSTFYLLIRHDVRTSSHNFLNVSVDTLAYSWSYATRNRRRASAETELRLATQKSNADSPTARYYLGLALVSQQKFDGAQSAFESAINNGGDKLALAHKYLGGLYWRNKRYREAADELEKYLKLEPKAPDAEKIRGTINELRQMI